MSRLYTIVGDPHLTHKSLEKMSTLVSHVEEMGNPTIWLGDLLDTKEVIRGKCLNFWIDYFERSELTHYVMVGNHDWFNLECQENSLRALKLLPNVEVIDKPTSFINLPFVLMPYIHDPKLLNQALDEIDSSKVVVNHIEVTDFDYGNGYICENGLTRESLSRFKRVISGHFHKFQQKGNLTFLGTPFSHSFGEANQTKYIATYDVQTDELKLIETLFPKHISIEFDCDRMSEDCQHMFFNIDDAGLWAKHYYRIILKGSPENIARFPVSMYLEAKNKLNIRFIKKPTQGNLNEIEIDENVSNEAQFAVWSKDIRKLDEATIQLGLEILGAVR